MTLNLYISILLSLPFVLVAQTEAITYGYDNAGNRIYRDVIVLMMAEESDSTLQEELTTFDDNTANDSNSTHQKEEDDAKTLYSDKLDGVALELYPNPTTGSIQVYVPDIDRINQGLIRVSDLNGRILIEEKVQQQELNLDLSSYPDGTYVLFLNINGKVNEWKVVKQR